MISRVFLGLALSALPSAAFAAEVTVVNQTGSALTSLGVRPYGSTKWESVPGALSNGARRSISGPGAECAFDIRATLAGGGDAQWSGVNFCETKVVTLNRRADGTVWADYD